VSETAEIERTIRMLEIALTIGKNLSLATSIFVGINLLLAAYDFATNNIGWGIANLLLGLAGLVFLVQMRQTRNRHRIRQAKHSQTLQEYHKVASA
jgi:hypothetical protein